MANLFHPLTNFNQTLILSRHTILPIPDIETQPENIATSSMLLLLPLLRGTRQNTLFTVGSSLLSCYGARTVSGFEAFLHWLNYIRKVTPKRISSDRFQSQSKRKMIIRGGQSESTLLAQQHSLNKTAAGLKFEATTTQPLLCFLSFPPPNQTESNESNWADDGWKQNTHTNRNGNRFSSPTTTTVRMEE